LIKQKIYSPNQVLAASMLGGPMAMIYVLWKNFQTLEDPNRSMSVNWYWPKPFQSRRPAMGSNCAGATFHASRRSRDNDLSWR
jgi:hypothetical protein